MRLLPNDRSFFAHFESQGRKTVEGCAAFVAMIDDPTRLTAKAQRIKQIENES
jgi:uncharacterized protein Yka (UPF0111/DUF47 family)